MSQSKLKLIWAVAKVEPSRAASAGHSDDEKLTTPSPAMAGTPSSREVATEFANALPCPSASARDASETACRAVSSAKKKRPKSTTAIISTIKIGITTAASTATAARDVPRMNPESDRLMEPINELLGKLAGNVGKQAGNGGTQ